MRILKKFSETHMVKRNLACASPELIAKQYLPIVVRGVI